MLIPWYCEENCKGDGEIYEMCAKASVVNTVYASFTDLDATEAQLTDDQIKLVRTSSRIIVGPFHPESPNAIDAALKWLDKGANFVLFEAKASADELTQVAEAISQLPPSRVLVALPSTLDPAANNNIIKVIEHLLPLTHGLVFPSQFLNHLDTISQIHELWNKTTRVNPTICIQCSKLSDDKSLPSSLHKRNIHLISSDKISIKEVASAFVSTLVTDRRDKLYSTVVTDPSGIALGLVYSSSESIVASITESRGIYYSRSRDSLWRKGDSSGAIQTLLRLDVDCDNDALKFTVLQHGKGFCHLERSSCWGEERGLSHLQATLQARKVSAPEGSYTSRLFKNPEFLRNKLLEEAQELAEATDCDHVAAEAADLIYFAMVKCASAGVSIADIESQLDLRALKVKRRPGNTKAYRIEAAKQILENL